MTDSTITNLSEITSFTNTDVIPVDTLVSTLPVTKKISYSNIKASLKTYFDTIYAALVHTHITSSITDIASYYAALVHTHTTASITDISSTYTSFTPAIIGTTTAGTGTYTTQLGFYYEVGKLVFIQVDLNWTAHTGTGNMRISGLPYSSANTGARNLMSISWNNIILLDTGNKLYAELTSSSNILSIFEIGSGSASSVPIDTSGIIRLSGIYLKA